MVDYSSDVIKYVESNGGKSEVTAAEVAEAVGCSSDTVYRHWGKADVEAESDDGGGVIEDTDAEDRAQDDHGQDVQLDTDTEDDEPEDVELEDDDDSKSYECGNCGHDVEYLQKNCGECGKKMLWSQMEGA